MDNLEALNIWKELRGEIKKIIQEELKSYVKWMPVKVITINNTTKMATVRNAYGNPDGSEDYTNVLNNSGVNLTVGDTVYIAYAYSPANAIITYKV